MEFTCPACSVALKQRTIEGIRMWVCDSCNGCAISLPIVRKELKPEVFKRIWSKLCAEKGVQGRSCPGCRKPLIVLSVPGKSGMVEIDVCRACQVLWFDDDEFMRLPPKDPKNVPAKDLATEVALVMATFKVDQIQRRADLEDAIEKHASDQFGIGRLLGDFLDW